MKRKHYATTTAVNAPYKRPRYLAFGRHVTTQVPHYVPRSISYRGAGGPLGPATGRISRTQEVKCLDYPRSSVGYDAAGVVTGLNLVQIGSSFFNRIGRRIRMKSVQIFGDIIPNPAATATFSAETIRSVIVYDRQTNGAYPALADIFEDTDQNGANTTNELSGINLNNRERFAILMDIKHKMPFINVATGVPTTTVNIWPTDGARHEDSDGSFFLDHFRKLKGMETHYKADSTPAVIGDIATGGLYLVTFGVTGNWVLNFKVRMRYNDD